MNKLTLLLLVAASSLTQAKTITINGHIPMGDLLYYNSSKTPNFVIRWDYQHSCDHVYDPRTDIWRWPTNREKGVTFDPDKVKPGDTIFVRDIPKFFKEMHPHIGYPYIIVIAGECLDKMRKSYIEYLDDDMVIAWYGIHANKMAMEHPKFRALPIGIEQHPDRYRKKEELNKVFTKIRATTEKKWWVYMNFADFQKPERKKLKKLMLNEPFCKHGKRVEFNKYLKQMAQSVFTLSPMGLGPDCYRTWEALLCGSIPIVRSCQLDPLYEGLPVLIVDKWEDLTQEFLEENYREITAQKYDIERLYSDFWIGKIRSEQEAWREKWRRGEV